MNESKIAEIAVKYELPLDMILRILEMERESVTLQNRRMTPRLRALISEASEKP
jgi:hypothetical protein